MEYESNFVRCAYWILECSNVEKDRKQTNVLTNVLTKLPMLRLQMLLHLFKETAHLCQQRPPSRPSCALALSSKDFQRSQKLFSDDMGSASKAHFLHRVFTPTQKTM